jgi:hypothetical protein
MYRYGKRVSELLSVKNSCFHPFLDLGVIKEENALHGTESFIINQQLLTCSRNSQQFKKFRILLP